MRDFSSWRAGVSAPPLKSPALDEDGMRPMCDFSSWRAGVSVPPLKSPAVNEDRMRPVRDFSSWCRCFDFLWCFEAVDRVTARASGPQRNVNLTTYFQWFYSGTWWNILNAGSSGTEHCS